MQTAAEPPPPDPVPSSAAPLGLTLRHFLPAPRASSRSPDAAPSSLPLGACTATRVVWKPRAQVQGAHATPELPRGQGRPGPQRGPRCARHRGSVPRLLTSFLGLSVPQPAVISSTECVCVLSISSPKNRRCIWIGAPKPSWAVASQVRRPVSAPQRVLRISSSLTPSVPATLP